MIRLLLRASIVDIGTLRAHHRIVAFFLVRLLGRVVLLVQDDLLHELASLSHGLLEALLLAGLD